MAILKLKNGNILTDMREIARNLSSLNVQIESLPIERYLTDPQPIEPLRTLLERDVLDLSQKQQLAQALHPKFTNCQHLNGYSQYELMVLNPTSPHLYDLLAQGSRPHSHSQDEVLYVLTGKCIFGFADGNGSIELMLQEREYIKVPAGLRHWFSLSASLQMKAMRYFTHVNRFIPQYTEWIADN